MFKFFQSKNFRKNDQVTSLFGCCFDKNFFLDFHVGFDHMSYREILVYHINLLLDIFLPNIWRIMQ